MKDVPPGLLQISLSPPLSSVWVQRDALHTVPRPLLRPHGPSWGSWCFSGLLVVSVSWFTSSVKHPQLPQLENQILSPYSGKLTDEPVSHTGVIPNPHSHLLDPFLYVEEPWWGTGAQLMHSPYRTPSFATLVAPP